MERMQSWKTSQVLKHKDELRALMRRFETDDSPSYVVKSPTAIGLINRSLSFAPPLQETFSLAESLRILGLTQNSEKFMKRRMKECGIETGRHGAFEKGYTFEGRELKRFAAEELHKEIDIDPTKAYTYTEAYRAMRIGWRSMKKLVASSKIGFSPSGVRISRDELIKLEDYIVSNLKVKDYYKIFNEELAGVYSVGYSNFYLLLRRENVGRVVNRERVMSLPELYGFINRIKKYVIHGYKLADVCNRVGIKPETVYNHFRIKPELKNEIFKFGQYGNYYVSKECGDRIISVAEGSKYITMSQVASIIEQSGVKVGVNIYDMVKDGRLKEGPQRFDSKMTVDKESLHKLIEKEERKANLKEAFRMAMEARTPDAMDLAKVRRLNDLSLEDADVVTYHGRFGGKALETITECFMPYIVSLAGTSFRDVSFNDKVTVGKTAVFNACRRHDLPFTSMAMATSFFTKTIRGSIYGFCIDELRGRNSVDAMTLGDSIEEVSNAEVEFPGMSSLRNMTLSLRRARDKL